MCTDLEEKIRPFKQIISIQLHIGVKKMIKENMKTLSLPYLFYAEKKT